MFGVFCVFTFALPNLELLMVFPVNREYCGPNDEGRENGKWSHLTGGGMIVSPASSPDPNHSGLWSVWLTIAGPIRNLEAVLNTAVLFFRRVLSGFLILPG